MEKLEKQPTFTGPADWFTGEVYGDPVFGGVEPSRMSATNVHFTPGARTHWHSHAGGQALYGTDGAGIVATRDGSVTVIRPGETVWCAPDEDHWHGALADHFMAHLAMLEAVGEGDPTTWKEPVDDAEYARANEAAAQELT